MPGSPPLPPLAERPGWSGRYVPAHPPGGGVERGRPRVGGNGRHTLRPLPSPATRRARAAARGGELGAGKATHLAAGPRAAGQRAPRSRARRAQAAGEGGGPRSSKGEVSWPGKVQLCAAIPGMSGGSGGRKPRGRLLPGSPGEGRRPGGQRREGCGRGGAVPRGGAAVWAGSAGAWPWPRSPGGRWHLLAQTVCPQRRLRPGDPGSRRGADGSGGSAARGGRRRGGLGRGHSGEGGGRGAATFEVLTVAGRVRRTASRLRSASRALPGPPGPRGRFRELRGSHVFRYLWVRNFPNCRAQQKEREPRRQGQARAAPSPRPSAHSSRLSLPLTLVLERMEEAGIDCAVAFAEAQRWVEVSAFTFFRTSLRPRGRSRRWALHLLSGPAPARGSRLLCSWGTLQVPLFLSFNIQLSRVLPSLRRARWLAQSSSARAEAGARPLGFGDHTSSCARPRQHRVRGGPVPRELCFGGVAVGTPDSYLQGQWIKRAMSGRAGGG